MRRGDTLPVLLAYDARIEVASADKTCTLPYSQFVTGYRQTVLAADEIIKRTGLEMMEDEEARLLSSCRTVMGVDSFLPSLRSHHRLALKAQADIRQLPIRENSFSLLTANPQVISRRSRSRSARACSCSA